MCTPLTLHNGSSWSSPAEKCDEGGDGDKTRGGFLSEGEAWAFDNSFFGISPAEARAMDPMQRMMLEVSKQPLPLPSSSASLSPLSN